MSSGPLQRPTFNLVYLGFYFLPWIWQTPNWSDMLAIALAVAVFLPLHYRSYADSTWRPVFTVLLIEAIGVALSPFLGTAATFHIYASVRAAYVRPERKGLGLIAGLAIFWAVYGLAGGLDMFDLGFGVAMGLLTGFQCFWAAEGFERQRLLQRLRVHDRREATTAERERIARDLHDRLGQSLTLMSVKTDLARRLLRDDPERALRELDDLGAAARGALSEMRSTAQGLATTSIEAEMLEARAVLDAAGVSFTVEGEPPELSTEESHQFGLVLREGVTNIVRHAGAASAVLAFTREGDAIRMVLSDDGRGFQAPEGQGIRGIKRRLAEIGAAMRLEAERGTRLVVEMPSRPART